MSERYDYLVVGAGLFGSVFAHEMHKSGRTVRVIDRRSHVGGNCFTKTVDGIHVHAYGPHVFHTDDKKIWDYVSQFVELRPFVNRPKVYYDGRFYSFPINLMTMNQVWGTKTPAEARERLKSVAVACDGTANFESWLLSKIGRELYDMFYREYTEKLWDLEPRTLPADVAKRVPIRLDFDDNYFDDTYQGVPADGYSTLFDRLLDGIRVDLDTPYLRQTADVVAYTGRIDDYYGYEYGKLDYRGLRFVEETHGLEDFQGTAVINYPERRFPFVRVTEHKHFLNDPSPVTVTTKEVPSGANGVPCYPVRSEKNLRTLAKYEELAARDGRVLFGGRLGTFRYLSMGDTISEALRCTRERDCS